MRADRTAARADHPVGNRQQGRMDAFQLRIEAADRNRPGLVPVGLRAGRRGGVARAGPAAIPERPPGRRRAQARRAGTPVGSRPTETADCALGFAGSRKESLPGSPPSGPNSSPATSTCAGPIPRRQSSAKIQRAESALSVRPISTCLASRRDLWLRQPGVARRLLRQADTLTKAVQPDGSQPALDCREQLADPGLRRIGPLGLGDDVDLAPVESLRHDLGGNAARGEPRHRVGGCCIERRLFRLRRKSANRSDAVLAHRRRRPRSRG